MIGDAALLSVFNPPPPNWQVPAFCVDWQSPDASEQLDPTVYRTSLTYDGLNRLKTVHYPQDVNGARKVLLPHYNRAGALEAVDLDSTTYVEHIAYNARGQRSLIAYGNGVLTRYAYDPQTFRLVRLCSERYSTPAALTYHPTGAPVQDLAYRYDLVGNIRDIQDRTPGSGVLNNPDALLYQGTDPALATLLTAGNTLIRHFAYDPLYRLLSATGRECQDIPSPRPWTDDARCGFNGGNHGTPDQANAPHLTALYHENYTYDPAGNLVALHHTSNSASWTRAFGSGGLTPLQWSQAWLTHLNTSSGWQNAPGNRVTHAGDDDPGVPQTHVYDASGNLIHETTSRHFEWDASGRLRAYHTQPGNAEPSVYALYLYDAGGQRVKKLVRIQGGQYEVTVYVDGLFEHHRSVQASATQENNTLHVMDTQSRIATVRVGVPFADDLTPAMKFHLGDHLGSSSLVVDQSGAWVNREEYTPYGETSLGSFARKRYRFTGKERDNESGLYYHGARYYAPWLARWVGCDPVGMMDGLNLYAYVSGNPLHYIDPSGLDGQLPATTGSMSGDGGSMSGDGDLTGGYSENAEFNTWSAEYNAANNLEGQTANTLPAGTQDAYTQTDPGGGFGGNSASVWTSQGMEGGEGGPSHPNDVGGYNPKGLQFIVALSVGIVAGAFSAVTLAAAGWTAVGGEGALYSQTVPSVAAVTAAVATAAPIAPQIMQTGEEILEATVVAETPIVEEAVEAGSNFHHIFPQEFRDDFERMCIDIDQFTIELDRRLHIMLHSYEGTESQPASYNDEWGMWLNDADRTREAAYQFAAELLNEYGLAGPEYPVVPYPK